MFAFFRLRFNSLSSRQFELMYGVCLALFAALLAVVDLQSGIVGTEEIKLVVGQNNAHQWYQAKSIKASLTRSQLETTELMMVGAKPQVLEGLQGKVKILKEKLDLYGKEQREILLGSKAVGQEQWVQKIDGKLGQVTGAKGYDAFLEDVAERGSRFDRGILWLQLSMVLGALGLIMSSMVAKGLLLVGTVLCDLLGTYQGVLGFL